MTHKTNNSEYIVIGAGFGGLAAAALLARRGFRVTLLEAMGLPGGCAQTFRRGSYRFDAGATTVVGLDPRYPLGALAAELGLRFDAESVDPAMTVWLDGSRINRHTGRREWIGEAMRHFGRNQSALWEDIFRTSDRAWDLAARVRHAPPRSIRDAFEVARAAFPAGLRMLPGLLTPTSRRIKSHLGTVSDSFERFVEEQLLITAQAGPEHVPFVIGAMGLSYTNIGNYVVRGGVGALAAQLAGFIRSRNGQVLYGRRVQRISRTAGGEYRVETKRDVHTARSVVSNLTIWDLAEVCDGEMGAHFGNMAASRTDAWGAFMLYLGVEDTFGDDPVLHHQVIFDRPLPVVGGHSVFVSLSPRGDLTRAPAGYRTVTVSAHTPVDPWWNVERDRYDERKDEVASAMLARIADSAPGLGELQVETLLTGTPRTFAFYTRRALGRVGGLPSTFSALSRSIAPVTPFTDFYLVGDTVYPGQGIPTVVLGARNVVERIAERAGADSPARRNFTLSRVQPEGYTS